MAILTAFAAILVRRGWLCTWVLGFVAVFLHCFVDYPMQQRPALAGWFFALMGVAAADGFTQRGAVEWTPGAVSVPEKGRNRGRSG